MQIVLQVMLLVKMLISCMDGGHQAISIGEDGKPILNPKKCVGFHLCVIVCPCDAIIHSKYEAEAK